MPFSSRTATPRHTGRSCRHHQKRLKIIQELVGREHASTTSLYTCVSSDFRVRTLRQALDETLAAALAPAAGVSR